MRRKHLSFVIALVTLLGGCSIPQPRPEVQYSPMPWPPEGANFATVRTFFATDRNSVYMTTPGELFGNSRSSLKYGVCDVSIPRDHRMGNVELPSMWFLEFQPSPSKHFVIVNTNIYSKHDFFKELSDKIKSKPGSKAFLFIHGYNVTFKDAAMRT